MTGLTCFKAYDIRGRLGSELNEEIAYKIGRAYCEYIKPENVVIGGDIRLTSEALKFALSESIRDSGVDVIDIGMVGTEQIYFATSYLRSSGGIIVTASHNPINFNGMKMVREESKPISADTGLLEIKKIAESQKFEKTPKMSRGGYLQKNLLHQYVQKILTYIDYESITPVTLILNPGNGAAGPVIDKLEEYFLENKVPIDLIKINNKPDGSFPNGIPNPILVNNRESTIKAVLQNDADMGIAWDGDFDRCFFIDEKGRFIEGYYVVGLLTEAFLRKEPGAKIVHDPRLIWNTLDVVQKYGGVAVQSRSGHAFIKEKMRHENAIYGGEMSAHHYFKDFFYCDSGMSPWLLVMELVCKSGMSLSKLLDQMIKKYPSPGEINFIVENPSVVLDRVFRYFQSQAINFDNIDGLSMEFIDWRFNIRLSNTEPLVRLNLETRSDKSLMRKKLKELSFIIESH